MLEFLYLKFYIFYNLVHSRRLEALWFNFKRVHNENIVVLLQEEHETILKKREGVNSSITWDEYKSMTFTAQVI
jgi:lipopolysaccharide biosynthesis protein